MAAADLPPEIVAEILSRLPVESLLRCRSTSKSLRSLIDSHNFINLHLKNSLNRSLIIRHKFDIYQLQIDDDFPNLAKSMMIPLTHPFSTKIDPFTRYSTNIDRFTRNRTMSLIGSCNGLLAISNGVIGFTHPNDDNEITLWNPNTRKHRIIHFLPLPIPNIPDPQVRLFRSKTNSWKIIPSMPYALLYVQAMGVFVENSLHWIMTPKINGSHPCLIVAFNLTLEIFNVVPLPAEIGGDEVNSNGSFKIDVAVLGGCLCMTVNYETAKIDVWVMKEYGCKDSWGKLFTLMESCFTSPLKSSRPLGYSSDGSKVLLEGSSDLKLFWYDLKSEQVSFVEGIPDFDEAMFCVGSLVPPSLSRIDKQTQIF